MVFPASSHDKCQIILRSRIDSLIALSDASGNRQGGMDNFWMSRCNATLALAYQSLTRLDPVTTGYIAGRAQGLRTLEHTQLVLQRVQRPVALSDFASRV